MIHSLDGGGAERVMAGLATRLARRGDAVSLITLDDGSRDRHPLDPSVRRVTLGVAGPDGSPSPNGASPNGASPNGAGPAEGRWRVTSRFVRAASFWRRAFAVAKRLRAIRRAIAEESPDVVLSFCDRMNVLTLAATAVGPGRRNRVPIVVAERSDPARQTLPAVTEWLRRRLYPRAARVIALTEPAAEHLRGFGCAAVEVIPSAVDVPAVFRVAESAAENRRIVGLGRLEPEKGFDRLIVAFAGVAAEFDRWSLRIVGEGSEREKLTRLAGREGLLRRVSMPGWKTPAWDELAGATLFVMPSRYEGFPSALMEAMAAGVPCVATDCDAARAIIRDGVDGLLVPGTVEGIAAGIRRLVADVAARERIGEAAIRVTERFGWDAMVASYDRVLDEAVRGDTNGPAI